MYFGGWLVLELQEFQKKNWKRTRVGIIVRDQEGGEGSGRRGGEDQVPKH